MIPYRPRSCREFPIRAAGAAFIVALMAASAIGADALRISFPADRDAFVTPEDVHVWLHLPDDARGSGELTLATENGTLLRLQESFQPGPAPAVLTYIIHSAMLCPGEYRISFQLDGRTCQAPLTIIEGTPATHFPIALATATPAGRADITGYAQLGFNIIFTRDPAGLDPAGLAIGRMRWMQEMSLKAAASPADQVMVQAGGRHVQLVAQAAQSVPGFAGVVIDRAPPLQAVTQTIDLIDIFNDEQERINAAMALLTAAAGKPMDAASLVVELKPTPARTIYMRQIKQLLLSGKADEKLLLELERLHEMMKQKQERDIPREVRRLLAGDAPIYQTKLVNPFADEHTLAAYRRKFGADAPRWWEGNANFGEWHRFLDFRGELWPGVVDAWSQCLREMDQSLRLLGREHRGAGSAGRPLLPARESREAGRGGIPLRRIRIAPGRPLQPLYETSRYRSQPVWMEIDPPETGPHDLRRSVMTSLAAGAAGIVCTQGVASPGSDFPLAAEAASLGDLTARHGDFLLGLERRRARLAILESDTTRCHLLGGNPLEHGDQTAYSAIIAEAWEQCVDAGFVPDILTESELPAALPRYSAVIAPCLKRLPDPHRIFLLAYTKAGGKVIVDSACEIDLDGAARLSFAFSAADAPPAQQAELAEALRTSVRSDIRCDGRRVAIAEFDVPAPARLFALIPTRPQPEPLDLTVVLPRGSLKAYDVFQSTEIGLGTSERGLPVMNVAVPAAQAKLIAVLQSPIGSVTVAPPKPADGALHIEASLADVRGAPVPTPVPATVIVLDESGAEHFRVHRPFVDSSLKLSLPLSANAPPGRWFVRVTELFSQRSHGTPFVLPERKAADGIISAAGPVMVFDSRRCVDFLKRARSLLLVSGRGPSREAARELARGLQRFAVSCEIQQDTEALRSESQSITDLALPGDAILLGNPADNMLVKHLAQQRLMPVSVDMTELPPGLAVVFWTRSAFRSDVQTITICATDEAGLRRGIQSLLKMIDQTADTRPRADRPVKIVEQSTAAPAIQPPPETLPPLFTHQMADSATGVAAPQTGRFALAAALSGDLYAVSSTGARVWHTLHDLPVSSILLPAKGSDPLVVSGPAAALYSVVSAEKWRLAAPDGLLAAAAVSPDGQRVAVGTSSGEIAVVNADGTPRWQARIGGSVDAIAFGGGKLAAAADGNVMLFDDQGRRLWRSELERCRCLVFSPDGSRILAGTENGIVRIMVADDGERLREFAMGSPVKGIVETPAGAILAAAESGEILRIPPNKQPPERLHLGHGVQVFASSPDSAYSAAAPLGSSITVFGSAGEIVRRLSIPGRRISCLAIAPGARLLLAGDWHGAVRAFRID